MTRLIQAAQDLAHANIANGNYRSYINCWNQWDSFVFFSWMAVCQWSLALGCTGAKVTPYYIKEQYQKKHYILKNSQLLKTPHFGRRQQE